MTRGTYTRQKDEKTIEKINRSLDTLYGLEKLLVNYRNGAVKSKADVARIMGISPMTFEHYLNSAFKSAVRKFTKEYNTYEALYDASRSPSDELLKVILGLPDEIRPIFPYYDEEYFWETFIPNRLTAKEHQVIKMRFLGIDATWQNPNERGATLEEVGKEFKVTRERIRQIENKAIRKLRFRKLYLQIFDMDKPTDNKIIKMLKDEVEERQRCIKAEEFKIAEMRNSIEIFKKQESELSDISKAIDELSERLNKLGIKPQEVNPLRATSIEDLDLTIRSFCCLQRAKITTVGDIIDAMENDSILKVRNLGKKSLQEIYDKITDLGIPVKNPIYKPEV